ncbi:MAG: VIT1/CCC1 transporter family protein [Candidatus Limnocylindria bacterium]
MFGAQDGLVSTLAVVSAVGGATGQTFPVLIAGIASALAGVFSMAAGEYFSSKSQREIFMAQIARERAEIAERPAEAEAEVAYMLEREGLSEAASKRVAAELARDPNVLLNTMVEKELGILVEAGPSALQGAFVMGGSFGIAAIVPIVPYLFLPVVTAVLVSVPLAAAVMFALGVVKSRWTQRSALVSGLEAVAVATVAGVAGFFFGSVLPGLLGVAGITT